VNTLFENCEDWIVRAKRGGLSESEQLQFRELLERSIEARLLYEADCAFDREAAVLPGDDARLEQIARRLQKRPRRQPLLARRGVRLLAAAGLLVAGAAVGAINYARDLRTDSSRSPRASTAQGATRTPVHDGSTAAGIPAVSNAKPERVEAETPLPSMLPARPASTDSPATGAISPIPRVAHEKGAPPSQSAIGRFEDLVEPPAERETAASLFSEGNRARVRGDARRAIVQYERLLSQFSSSREAQAARLSLGVLYLNGGQPRRALHQFETYRSSAGPLTAECLWGEAEAWNALGQPENERRALARIVQEFPQSAYAAGARTRLSQ
jgi:TolA-binding protein